MALDKYKEQKYSLLELISLTHKNIDLFDKLHFIENIFDSLQLMEVTTYIKYSGLNGKTVRNRLKAGKIPYITLGKTDFIIKKLV